MRETWKRWALAALVVCTVACGVDTPTTPSLPDASPSARDGQPKNPAPPPTPVNTSRPLTGLLTIRDGILYDAIGPRRAFGYTDMPALRIWDDNQLEELSTLDAAHAAGYQYVRIAYGLAETETQDGGYWRGAMVSPELAQRTLIPFAKAAWSRGIRLHLFGGHDYGTPQVELDFIRWMANAFRDNGLSDAIALFEWRNEWTLTYPKRTPGYDRTSPWDLARQASQIMHDATGCLTTMGSPGEDDAAIQQTISGAMQVAAIDLGRGYSGSGLMKHVTTVYYHGRYQGFFKGALLWATEPTGPQGVDGDVYLPLNDTDYLWGYYATYAVTGQVVTFFNGPAVRHRTRIDSTWGFYELPKLLRNIPEDIGTYRGPSWFTNGKQFYAVLAEEWGMHMHPDRPIKWWRMIRATGFAVEGDGPTIKVAPGWKAALFVGEWQ
jgi:hypothetical protein